LAPWFGILLLSLAYKTLAPSKNRAYNGSALFPKIMPDNFSAKHGFLVLINLSYRLLAF
jgi:hypothetical protein